MKLTFLSSLLVGLGMGLAAGTPASKPARVPQEGETVDAATGLVTFCTVKGRAIHPQADLHGSDLSATNLRNCDLRGANLRGANLRHAELNGANLAGADLRNADLTGTDLELATLTGASLEGARLFKAAINLAIGLNPAGAQPHPFFQDDPEPRLGDLRFLELSDVDRPSGDMPHQLTPSPDGRLFWLFGQEPWINIMGLSGAGSSLGPVTNTKLYTLFLDGAGRLWSTGNAAAGFHLLSELDGTQAQSGGATYTYARVLNPHRPKQISAGAGASLWVSEPGRLLRLDIQEGGYFHWNDRTPPLGPQHAGAWGLFSPGAGKVILAIPHPAAFLVSAPEGPVARASIVALGQGRPPRAMVEGPDGRLWFTAYGFNGVGWLDPRTLKKAFLPCPEDLVPADQVPHGLACAKDGSAWLTFPQLNAIVRRAPDGSFQKFPLPPNSRPMAIAAGFDGRMYFNLEGKARLGSIGCGPGRGQQAAVQDQAEPQGAASASSVGPERQVPARAAIYHPRPDRPKGPSRAERYQAHERHLEQAEARRQTAQRTPQEEPPGPSTPPPSSSTLPPSSSTLPPSPPPVARQEGGAVSAPFRPSNPWDRLWALDVNLSEAGAQHILTRHGDGAHPDKSRFVPAHQSPEALARLLASGLGGTGGIARERVVDQEGRHLTHCQAEQPIGYYQRRGERVPTRTFRVVTESVMGEDGFAYHEVLTAYPVPEDW